MFKIENKLFHFDSSFISSYPSCCFIGMDEVGRGALAGPVIACAFTWRNNFFKSGKKKNLIKLLKDLNDSKQLTRIKRNELFKHLVELGYYALGYSSVLEIEKLNILNATFLAMNRAFNGLVEKYTKQVGVLDEPYLLIDGNKFNPLINCRQLPIVRGDANSSLIASASIIAKVYRDSLMFRLSKVKQFNCFGWNSNVGYGTLVHRKAIRKHGLTPLHRKLFVRKIFSS